MKKDFSYPRDFKGVFIPKEIWLDDELNATEKIILAEIDSLDVEGSDGCYASNEYLSYFCKCSVTKVSTSISKLIKHGYVRVAKTDGRTRWLKASLSKFENQNNGNEKSEQQKMKESNINNNTPDVNSKANSFFVKKVGEWNKFHNPPEINQDELKQRIYDVAEDARIDLLTDNQADNVERCIFYFIDQYAEVFGQKHPQITERTIYSVIANITGTTEFDRGEFITFFQPLVSDEEDDDSFVEIIDMYFRTEFSQDVDYSIVHFSQPGVFTKLMGKAMEKTWFYNSSV